MALYHEVHGDGRPGVPSVLLSSGLGGSAGFWRPQIPALVEVGWRVVAYDQRGTGRSPADLPAGYAIADMARDVAEVMKATGTERCHLVGHAQIQHHTEVPVEGEILRRIHAGLLAPESGVSAAEATWVVRRLAELLGWEDPELPEPKSDAS